MQTTSLPYKLIKKIRDERFDEDLLHKYDLLIQIGSNDFQVAVIDSGENRILWLEDYVLPNITEGEFLGVLDTVFDSHELLKAGFWNRIKISFKNSQFAQIPQALFIPEALPDYLRLNAPYDADRDSLAYVNNPRANAVTVFASKSAVLDWLEKMYPTKKPLMMHQAACLIESTMNYAATRQDRPLYIYIDRFKLHILSCTGEKLVYYNHFMIRQFSDYVKYIMLVMKLLEMDQKSSQVVLWGYIGQNSPHYHEFYKYISNVSFGERPSFLQFGFEFDEVQDHYFADLYGMHLIG